MQGFFKEDRWVLFVSGFTSLTFTLSGCQETIQGQGQGKARPFSSHGECMRRGRLRSPHCARGAPEWLYCTAPQRSTAVQYKYQWIVPLAEGVFGAVMKGALGKNRRFLISRLQYSSIIRINTSLRFSMNLRIPIFSVYFKQNVIWTLEIIEICNFEVLWTSEITFHNIVLT